MARFRLRRRAGEPIRDDPEVTIRGVARVDRRTKDLVRRLRPREVAVIDHRDLDRIAAESLVESQPAAVLNAASTIFSIDIYHSYLNKRASQKQLVAVGRICVGVFVVIGCVVAPLLDDPKFGGIFTYIQEFQGYVSPGVLAVFIFGLLNRTASGATGVTGLLLNPVLYFLFKRYLPQLDFLNRMALCMVIVLAVMTAMGFVARLPKPVVFQ